MNLGELGAPPGNGHLSPLSEPRVPEPLVVSAPPAWGLQHPHGGAPGCPPLALRTRGQQATGGASSPLLAGGTAGRAPPGGGVNRRPLPFRGTPCPLRLIPQPPPQYWGGQELGCHCRRGYRDRSASSREPGGLFWVGGDSGGCWGPGEGPAGALGFLPEGKSCPEGLWSYFKPVASFRSSMA